LARAVRPGAGERRAGARYAIAAASREQILIRL
jgi:hypothetical protein